MFKWFNSLILLAVLVACTSGSDSDSDSDSIRNIAGLKTLAVDYSSYTDPNAIPDEVIPTEVNGFITISASSKGEVIIAGAAHGMLYYSGNGGVTWFTLDGIGVKEFWSGASVSADGQIIAVVAQSLYVSFDSGDNWTVYPFEDGYDADSRLVMSDDGSTLVRFADYELEVSYDFGDSWITPEYPIFNQFVGISMTADGSKIASLNYGERLRLSLDNGMTWDDASPDIIGLPVVQPEDVGWTDMAMTPDGQVIVLLIYGSKYYPEEQFDVYISKDGGDNWSLSSVEGVTQATAVAITDDGQKIIVSSGRFNDPFMLSQDFGVTWNMITAPAKENSYEPYFKHVFSNSGNRLVTMELQHSLWTSEDLGQTWVKRLQGLGQE